MCFVNLRSDILEELEAFQAPLVLHYEMRITRIRHRIQEAKTAGRQELRVRDRLAKQCDVCRKAPATRGRACGSCASRKQQRNTNTRARQIAAGLCSALSCKQAPVAGKRMCAAHLAADARRSAASKARRLQRAASSGAV